MPPHLAANRARARLPGCGQLARRRSRAPTRARLRSSRVSTIIVRYGRTSCFPSPFEPPVRPALLQFREKKMKKEKGRGGGCPLLPFRVRYSGLALGCPLPGAALYRPIPPIPPPPALSLQYVHICDRVCRRGNTRGHG